AARQFAGAGWFGPVNDCQEWRQSLPPLRLFHPALIEAGDLAQQTQRARWTPQPAPSQPHRRSFQQWRHKPSASNPPRQSQLLSLSFARPSPLIHCRSAPPPKQGRTIKITDERHPEPVESQTDVSAAHSVHRLVGSSLGRREVHRQWMPARGTHCSFGSLINPPSLYARRQLSGTIFTVPLESRITAHRFVRYGSFSASPIPVGRGTFSRSATTPFSTIPASLAAIQSRARRTRLVPP